MSFWIYPVYLAPYAIAVFLTRYAISLAAQRLIIFTSAVMLTGFILVFVLTAGCNLDDFTYHSCPLVADSVGKYLSMFTMLLMLGYFFMSPVLALVAGLMEILARRNT